MFAAGVVESIDVFEEGVADLAARCPSVPPDYFGFQGFEEGHDSCIVVTVAFAVIPPFLGELLKWNFLSIIERGDFDEEEQIYGCAGDKHFAPG